MLNLYIEFILEILALEILKGKIRIQKYKFATNSAQSQPCNKNPDRINEYLPQDFNRMTSMVMIHRVYCECNLDFAGNSISYLVFISEQFCGYKFHLAINTFIHLKCKPFRRTERINSTQVQLFCVRIRWCTYDLEF